MGPDKDSPTPAKNQDTWSGPRTGGRQHRVRRPRRRVCLLKGCGQVFRPQQPRTRYCGDSCREKARQWRQWKARQRYRQSPNGKQKRQAQNHRYRERRKEQARENTAAPAARVIPINFFPVPATVRVAMGNLIAPGGRPSSGFVPPTAATRWSAFGSGSDAGANDGGSQSGGKSLAPPGVPRGDEACRYRPHILHSPRPAR